MKICGIIIALIVLIGVIFYFVYLDEEAYDITREEQIIFISDWIEDLEGCQGYSEFSSREEVLGAGYSQFCFDSTDIGEKNLGKLRVLENLRGILVYDGLSSDYDDFTGCNLLWKFDYEHVVVRLTHSRLSIYECGDEFYIVSSFWPGAPTINVYRTNFNKEVIDKIKG